MEYSGFCMYVCMYVTIRGNWGNSTWDLCSTFATSYEPIIEFTKLNQSKATFLNFYRKTSEKLWLPNNTFGFPWTILQMSAEAAPKKFQMRAPPIVQHHHRVSHLDFFWEPPFKMPRAHFSLSALFLWPSSGPLHDALSWTHIHPGFLPHSVCQHREQTHGVSSLPWPCSSSVACFLISAQGCLAVLYHRYWPSGSRLKTISWRKQPTELEVFPLLLLFSYLDSP